MITKVPFAAARLAAASSPKRVKEVWAVRAAATNITVEDNTTRIFYIFSTFLFKCTFFPLGKEFIF